MGESKENYIPKNPNPQTYWAVLRTLTIFIVVFCLGVIGYIVFNDYTESTLHRQALESAFWIIGLVPIAYVGFSTAYDKIGQWIERRNA